MFLQLDQVEALPLQQGHVAFHLGQGGPRFAAEVRTEGKHVAEFVDIHRGLTPFIDGGVARIISVGRGSHIDICCTIPRSIYDAHARYCTFHIDSGNAIHDHP